MTDAIDRLLMRVCEAPAAQRLPESTYRLQLHADFTFRDAAEWVPYLSDLGITDCYASPFLQARPGSRHGYDITDHRRLNPEIGSEADFAAWTAARQSRELGLILDTVPNHMGVGNDNVWWNDVLENGPSSPYAGYFDIAWSASPRPELRGRILIPILGEPFASALEAQQIQLDFAAGSFALRYFEHRLPVAPHSYQLILGHRLEELETLLGPEAPALQEYRSILTAIKHLPGPGETATELVAERQREKEVIKRRLAGLTAEVPPIREFLEQTVHLFNGRRGEPASFDLLEALLNDQVYRLAYWRVAADEINYRRFFDINELAALSMEREEVFAATHSLVLSLLRDNVATGLRIDHPDGLYDPRQYLQRLQQSFLLEQARAAFDAAPDFAGIAWQDLEPQVRERIAALLQEPHGTRRWPLYVVVEKILGSDETLPADWPCHGTSGYDFLNLVNGLFVDSSRAEAFTRLYRDWTQSHVPFLDLAFQCKRLILQVALSSELEMLSNQLDHLAQMNRWSRDFTRLSLRRALREIIACFPVYRSYSAGGTISETDRKRVLRAVRRAAAHNPALSSALIQFVRDILVLRDRGTGSVTPEFQADQLRFVGKFQQVTAPVMAKGVEDTAFYVFNRLLSLNEVGGDPERFGMTPAALHGALAERQAREPWALSASSTHDTKRSEDVRGRLNVLSELPEEWQACLHRWSGLNEPHRVRMEEETVPDTNEEYQLYQTLVGAWPIEPCSPSDYATFVERIQAYMRKALQEAKVHTSWINPNVAYDEAIQQFIARILDPAASPAFLHDLGAWQKRISHYGMFNSLSQVVVKLAAPGVADFYQGTEWWDLSLVDPDNRRPVDFAQRQKMLRELLARTGAADRVELAQELTAAKEDGRIKMHVTCRGLRCRREHPGLFTCGSYVPLEVTGERREHVFGFARRHKSACAIAVAPRLLTRLIDAEQAPCGASVWQDAALQLPEGTENRAWHNIFTGENVASHPAAKGNMLSVGEVLAHIPVAILLAQDPEPSKPGLSQSIFVKSRDAVRSSQ